MKISCDDKELLSRLRKGDLYAFEKIFKRYYSRLCLFAEDYIKESALAEEIVSGLFIKIWERKETIDINTSINSYLYRSVHNNCLQYLERLKVFDRYKDFASAMIQARQISQDSENQYPLANLISREIETEIETAINDLPGKCKEVFCLHRFEDLSYEEISQKLGISINTVRTQMMRALQKLRESLKDYLPSSPENKKEGPDHG
ncbi:MAG: RNA polymerase sigma-70 factor [Bacteroidales bacterium]|nr:RNA polymerase sigma-70 factor [Bacteroidales bacterium]